MLKGGIPIGKAFGISLRLHYSWFLIFALVTWLLVASYYPTVYPGWGLATRIGVGLLTSVLFFASVLVHELMHSYVALREGIKVDSIVLFVLGGVSQMTEEPKKASDEFRMAFAGPATSLVLGGIFFAIFLALPANSSGLATQITRGVTFWLGYINIALGVFNLIPAFPLDGGRVLRSIIWGRNKNLMSATHISANIGRAFGFLFIFGGIVYIFYFGNWFNGIWLALVGWFLESAAASSYRQLQTQELLKGHVAREIMTQDCQIVPPDITLEKLVNEQILSSGRRCYPVMENDSVEGLITSSNVRTVPRERWNTTMVKEAMTPLDTVKSVSPNEDLNTVFDILVRNDINQVPVVEDHHLLGMVGRDNLFSFINRQNEFRR